MQQGWAGGEIAIREQCDTLAPARDEKPFGIADGARDGRPTSTRVSLYSPSPATPTAGGKRPAPAMPGIDGPAQMALYRIRGRSATSSIIWYYLAGTAETNLGSIWA